MPPNYKHRLLRLHFAQLWRSWNRSRGNVYRDAKKQEYQKQLQVLFDKLSEEDFLTLNETQVEERQRIIFFFFKNLEFLDSSTLNLIPFEIVECLNQLLLEWIPDHDSYIITTSLVNNYLNVSFDPVLAANQNYFKTLIKNVYGIDFNSVLIQFNFPKYLVRDYLFGAVMYHELGHFVDITYKVVEPIIHDIGRKMGGFTPDQWAVFKTFFPDFNLAAPNFKVILSHLQEYYADVFAAQYIENCSNHFVYYHSPDVSTALHPSPSNRIKMVEDFLTGSSNFILDMFGKSTSSILGKELKVRFVDLDRKAFINIVPYKVENQNELHSLIRMGWDIWLNHTAEMKAENNMLFDLSPRKSYVILNNLIEKSIGNYIVRNKWNKARE